MQNSKKHFGIIYNAPVTLSFSLLCVAVLFFQTKLPEAVSSLFLAPSRPGTAAALKFKEPLQYLRLFLHVFAHSDIEHLVSNLSFLLLLGPGLEERFGGPLLALMMATAAFVTAVINACFVPVGLLGASGIVFMMILLSSYTTIDRSQIPLTFVLICILYIGNEIASFKAESQSVISAFAHITGGIAGSLFGFLTTTDKKTGSRKKTAGTSAAKTKAPKEAGAIKNPPEPMEPKGY